MVPADREIGNLNPGGQSPARLGDSRAAAPRSVSGLPRERAWRRSVPVARLAGRCLAREEVHAPISDAFDVIPVRVGLYGQYVTPQGLGGFGALNVMYRGDFGTYAPYAGLFWFLGEGDNDLSNFSLTSGLSSLLGS
jgi:hypothetical protein